MSLVSYSNISKNKWPSLSFCGLRNFLYRPSIATHSKARFGHVFFLDVWAKLYKTFSKNQKKKRLNPLQTLPPFRLFGSFWSVFVLWFASIAPLRWWHPFGGIFSCARVDVFFVCRLCQWFQGYLGSVFGCVSKLFGPCLALPIRKTVVSSILKMNRSFLLEAHPFAENIHQFRLETQKTRRKKSRKKRQASSNFNDQSTYPHVR